MATDIHEWLNGSEVEHFAMAQSSTAMLMPVLQRLFLAVLVIDRNCIAAGMVRRCYVCVDKSRGESEMVEVLEALPDYRERCAEVHVESPAVCTDLLGPDGVTRLRKAESKAMSEAMQVPRGMDRAATKRSTVKMHEASILGSAIHWLQRRSSGDSWAAVMDAMQDAGLNLGVQGLSDAASTVVRLREDVVTSRVASGETLGSRADALGATSMQGVGHTAGDSDDGNKIFIVGPQGAEDTGLADLTLPRLPRDPLYEGF